MNYILAVFRVNKIECSNIVRQRQEKHNSILECLLNKQLTMLFGKYSLKNIVNLYNFTKIIKVFEY